MTEEKTPLTKSMYFFDLYVESDDFYNKHDEAAIHYLERAETLFTKSLQKTGVEVVGEPVYREDLRVSYKIIATGQDIKKVALLINKVGEKYPKLYSSYYIQSVKGNKRYSTFTGKLEEDVKMTAKERAIKKLTEKIEKETGKKVVFEAKEETALVKKDEKAAATNKPTLGNIMPESSIMLMNEYLQETFADLETQVAELKGMKISKDAQASTEDYYKKIEKAQFDLKQIARVCQYSNNVIKINHFDKNLLDMILNAKPVS